MRATRGRWIDHKEPGQRHDDRDASELNERLGLGAGVRRPAAYSPPRFSTLVLVHARGFWRVVGGFTWSRRNSRCRSGRRYRSAPTAAGRASILGAGRAPGALRYRQRPSVWGARRVLKGAPGHREQSICNQGMQRQWVRGCWKGPGVGGCLARGRRLRQRRRLWRSGVLTAERALEQRALDAGGLGRAGPEPGPPPDHQDRDRHQDVHRAGPLVKELRVGVGVVCSSGRWRRCVTKRRRGVCQCMRSCLAHSAG